ncbi:MAG: hypothetical protein PHW75_00215 [Patescibacteria group bacterium]|nr:hypothetical protein [Patescibacteria group bacterium]
MFFQNKEPKEKKDKRQFLADSTVRPYWHVDAKWVFGIFFAIFLFLALFSYGVAKFTERENAVDIMSYIMASSFSPGGIDSTSEIDDLKDMIKLSDDGYVKPIEGLNIKIKGEDVEGKTPREVRLMIFSSIAGPVYDGGGALEGIAANEAAAKNIKDNLGLLSFMNSKYHDLFYSQAIVFSFIALAFLAPLIYFSFHFGRLVSPAAVAFFVAGPGALFWGLVHLVSENIQLMTIPFIEEGEGSQKIATGINEIILQILPKISDTFFRIYSTVCYVAVGLIIIAIIGKVVTRFREKT